MHPVNWGVVLFESALVIVTAFRDSDDRPPSPTVPISVDAPRFSTSVET